MRRAPVLAALTLACEPEHLVSQTHHDHASEGAWQSFPCVERRKFDLLLVVEDGPAMAEEQAQVAEAARFVVDMLDHDRETDFRLAITRSQVGGPHCPPQLKEAEWTTTACRVRLADFGDPSGAPAQACLTACPFDHVDLWTHDGAAPRPWLESASGRTNLAAGVSLGDAAACLALQGVHGCEFPAPLAAIERALTRSLDPTDPGFGFLRADATLVVAVIAATSDCSVTPQSAAIFDPSGDHHFWSDPSQPTPGVCWNAGVRCSGAPPEFDACTPFPWDPQGQPAAEPLDAAMIPVEHTVALLRGLVDAGVTREVFVTALAGVPSGFETGGAVVPYSLSCSPELLASEGICPGCTSAPFRGAPPVRVAALAKAFAHGATPSVASICSDAPQKMWIPLSLPLDARFAPACVDTCVKDHDPTTPTLDPHCTATWTDPGEEPVALPTCEVEVTDSEPIYRVPAGRSACAMLLTDRWGETPDRLDDLSPECAEEGHNAELRVITAAQPLDGACVAVRCIPSDRPEHDCPHLHRELAPGV